ncbi:hypothetical protein GCM10009835_43140 [Planosporangium flavigriseum]|uniref:TIGR02611 family protein n=1 Tax=Planosporangium flavigriseum TaxID=373681 RepID=A0A8J3PMA3_9ACTN|nr:PGPGW domain-containing protein [Planosporangium flavigriseum]GIG74702.1 hypothetical protein Pfl04_31060 [Planosporangium flavigriseum]
MEGFDSDERPPSRTPLIKRSLTARIGPIRTWFHSVPGGPALFRLLVGLTGLVVVAVGLALVPLPGPGWVIVLGGVAIWAIEFMWARHLLRYTTEQLYRWNVWQRGQHWLVRVFLLLAVLAITATVVWLSIKQTFGFDVIDYVLGVGWAG